MEKSSFHILANWFRQVVRSESKKERNQAVPSHLGGYVQGEEGSLRPLGQIRRELLLALESANTLDRHDPDTTYRGSFYSTGFRLAGI